MSMQVSRMFAMPVQRAKAPIFAGKSAEEKTTVADVITWLLSGNKTVKNEGFEGFLTLSTNDQVKVIQNIIKPRKKVGKTDDTGIETGKKLLFSAPADRQAELLRALYKADETTELQELLESLGGKTDVKVIGKLAEGANAELKTELANLLFQQIKPGTASLALREFIEGFSGPEVQEIAAKAFNLIKARSEIIDTLAAIVAGNTKLVRMFMAGLPSEKVEVLLMETAQAAAKKADQFGREVSQLTRENNQLKDRAARAEASAESYSSGIRDGSIYVKSQRELDEEHAQMIHDMTR